MTPDWRMTHEIAEQPDLFEDCASTWQDRARRLHDATEDRPRLVLLGRGSSRNASVFASHLAGVHTGLHPVEFRLWVTTRDDVPRAHFNDTTVFAYSASGQSTDIARACRWLSDRGAFIIGITNADDANCALGEAADELLLLDVGDERAVPATKTFNAQLFASAALLGLDIIDAVTDTARCLRQLQDSSLSHRLADFLDGGQTAAWIARGPSLGAARDAALKCRECARLDSTGWSSAEIQHGHIGSLDANDRAIIFSDANQPAGSFSSVAKAFLGRNTPFLVVGLDYYRDNDGSAAPQMDIPLPQAHWARAPVFAFLAQQTALQLAVRRGLNPDCPSGLQKVTETV